MMDLAEIKKQLKEDLDKNRWKHTKGVASTAQCMAMRYGMDLDQAYLAGLLHDCAKCIADDEKIRLCKHYGYELTAVEKHNSALIHAPLGSYVAADKYGIEDKDVLSAIRWHTTGHADMTMLEKVIYIADYIEPGRFKQKNLDKIRMQAFVDIDECVYMISKDTLEYLEASEKDPKLIDSFTRQTYEFYKDIHDRKVNK